MCNAYHKDPQVRASIDNAVCVSASDNANGCRWVEVHGGGGTGGDKAGQVDEANGDTRVGALRGGEDGGGGQEHKAA